MSKRKFGKYKTGPLSVKGDRSPGVTNYATGGVHDKNFHLNLKCRCYILYVCIYSANRKEH